MDSFHLLSMMKNIKNTNMTNVTRKDTARTNMTNVTRKDTTNMTNVTRKDTARTDTKRTNTTSHHLQNITVTNVANTLDRLFIQIIFYTCQHL